MKIFDTKNTFQITLSVELPTNFSSCRLRGVFKKIDIKIVDITIICDFCQQV